MLNCTAEVVIMSKVVTPEVTVDDAAEYARAIEQMFVEMKRANERMARDQEEIERLKARTHETLARLEAA